MDKMMQEEAAWFKERDARRRETPTELPWFQRASQEAWFEEWRVPWYRDPDLGPMLLP